MEHHMSFLADKIPTWVTAVFATIGLASTVVLILMVAAAILTDWKRSRREDWEAERIKSMSLPLEVEVWSWPSSPQPARWQ
jgi:hypothetical protein